MLEALIQIDKQLFLYLNDINNPFWDEVMYYVSGRATWIPLYVFILFLIIRQYKKQSIIIFLGAILLITLSDQLSVHLFKNVFERLRPCHNPEIQPLVHIVHNHCGGKYGFISSHAANSFAIAFYTSLYLKKNWYNLMIFLWATWVSYSRIYLGVHYPGDVISGALIGVILGMVIFILSRIFLKDS